FAGLDALGPPPRARELDLLGDVATRTEQSPGLVTLLGKHLADRVEDAHRAVGPHDALAVREATTALDRCVDLAVDALAVVGGQRSEKHVECDRLRPRLESVDPIQFVRPGHGARGEIPLPAADV